MAKRKVSEAEVLKAVEEFRTRDTEFLANHFGVDPRTIQKKLRNIGRLNIDNYLAGNTPGIGREIVSVTTRRDRQGDVVSSSVVEKQISGDHEPIIDAPIIRQSRLTGQNGEVLAQWDIRSPRDHQEAYEAVLNGFVEQIVPQPPILQLPLELNDHLVNHIVLSDVHVGSLLFEEDPLDYETLIVRSFERMIDGMPRARTCVLVNLGDWFNFDTILPLTSRSKNVLFANMHYHDMVQAAIRILRKVLNAALFYHEEVQLVIADGNHDDVSALWLRIMMMALYQDEPRVKIVDSDNGFFALKLGDLFLGYHHGHEKSIRDVKDLILTFADEYADFWGSSKYRYIHHGHYHHLKKAEEVGAEVIQHPTLAGKELFGAKKNFRSKRAAIGTTYSKIWGDGGEVVIRPEMILS